MTSSTQSQQWFGLKELDRKIAEHVRDPVGTFVELGAADGVNQSNSLHFESKGWRGVLIEPVPAQFEACLRNRPLAQVFNCACVPPGQEGFVDMTVVGLMSLVVGALGGGEREAAWIERGAGFSSAPYPIRTPARTLTSVLEEARLSVIDLLVLDVEGYEAPVLEGLDFSRFAPRWIVAEDRYDDEVKDHLEPRGYELTSVLNEKRFSRDRLFRRLAG